MFLAYASLRSRGFLDRESYLPPVWADDADRRRAAGGPPEASFHTKLQLARRMLERAFGAEVPAARVAGEAVYGNDDSFRRWLEEKGRAYVLAGARSHMVRGAGVVQRRVEAIVADLLPEVWHRIDVGAGGKEPRVHDWACRRLPYVSEPSWAQQFLVRRPVSDPKDLAFYRVLAPVDPPLAEMARVAGAH